MNILRISIFEITASIALIGMGVIGMISGKGLETSSFFPIIRESVQPIIIALFLLTLGGVRASVLIFAPKQITIRFMLAGISAMVWAQWAAGFAIAFGLYGLRPGIAQLAAFMFGEFLLIYFLIRNLR